jgi:hypothetical protein
MELLYIKRNMFNSKRNQYSFQQRYRFNDKFSVSHYISIEPQVRNVGFANHYTSAGVPTYFFGRRDRETVENMLSFKYSFSSKMNINTRLRHYWSKVDYDQLYDLVDNGKLQENSTNPDEANQNYNAFTVDAVFTWQFAPGSFVNIVWKDAAYDFKQQAERGYFKNFGNTLEVDQNNNLSLKVIYFLDYLQLKNKKKKTP